MEKYLLPFFLIFFVLFLICFCLVSVYRLKLSKSISSHPTHSVCEIRGREGGLTSQRERQRERLSEIHHIRHQGRSGVGVAAFMFSGAAFGSLMNSRPTTTPRQSEGTKYCAEMGKATYGAARRAGRVCASRGRTGLVEIAGA